MTHIQPAPTTTPGTTTLLYPLNRNDIEIYRACPREFWTARQQGAPTPELDAQAKILIRAAVDVRKMAQGRFKKNYEVIPTHESPTRRSELTEAALNNQATQAIFQSYLYYANPDKGNSIGVELMADLLVRDLKAGAFNLHLIKADNSPYLESAYVSVKTGEITRKKELDPRVMRELALQLYVLEGNGLPIGKTLITHVNPDYQHPGGYEYNLENFLRDVEVNPDDLRQLYPEIEEELAAMSRVLGSSNPDEIAHDEKCAFERKKWEPHDIRLLKAKKEVQARLDAAGITDIRLIPDNFDDGIKSSARLSDKQWRLIRAVKANALDVDQDGIASALKRLQEMMSEPGAVLSLLDFETIQPVIPVFKEAKPFDYNTLQSSNHKIRNWNDLFNETALEHDQFVYQGNRDNDWASALTDHLLETVEAAGPIVVWNQQFEIGRIIELAEIMETRGETEKAARLYSLVGGNKKALLRKLAEKARGENRVDVAEKILSIIDLDNSNRDNMAQYFIKNGNAKEYGEAMIRLLDNDGRIVDLLKIIRDFAYHPGFKGSFSLKNVLPALTGRDYTELDDDINVGIEASLALAELVGAKITPGRRAELLEKLYAYCHMDTYAEVLILRVIAQAIGA